MSARRSTRHFACPSAPVVIADRSDNAGAGAASDSTYILAELIERGVTDTALGMIWDPMAVRACHDAGVGARLPLRIGGKAGRLSGAPIDADVEVFRYATMRCRRCSVRANRANRSEDRPPY